MRYLEFTASDDGHGHGSWEAMASVRAIERDAALAEAQQLLATAEREAPGPRGPEEDGGVWDALLAEQLEDGGWFTITLTLTGPSDWGESLIRRCAGED